MLAVSVPCFRPFGKFPGVILLLLILAVSAVCGVILEHNDAARAAEQQPVY